MGALQAVCLGSSAVLSGLFYYVYRKKRRTADKLCVRSSCLVYDAAMITFIIVIDSHDVVIRFDQ